MQNATMTFTLTGPDPLIFGMWRDLDARGHRIKNLADAVDDQDAVTLKQMQEAIGDGGGGDDEKHQPEHPPVVPQQPADHRPR